MEGSISWALPRGADLAYRGRMQIGAGGLGPTFSFGLCALALLTAGCIATSAPRGSQGPARLDQRMVQGGFMLPRRAPKPRKQLLPKPTLLAVSRGMFFPLPAPATSSPSAPSISSFLAPLGIASGGVPPKANRLPARGGCGYVNVGARQITLDCSTPGYGLVQSAALPLVGVHRLRSSEWHAGAAELPSEVDHRAEGEEGPVRDQDAVGACTAFSLAAAIDHSVFSQTGQPGAVSAMHIWARYHVPYMDSAVTANRGHGITSEQEWPYSQEWRPFACAWASCDNVSRCRNKPCGKPVDAASLRAADTRPRYLLNAATVIHSSYMGTADPQKLTDALAKGQDIWIAMGIAYSAFDDAQLLPHHDGLKSVIRDFDANDVPQGQQPSSHAMTIVGYSARAGGTYFLLKNSWSESWGDGGYAWVHQTTLLRNLHAAYVIQADALGAQSNVWKTPAAGGCTGGLLPDSETGQCVPACSDGSPRDNGVCADPTDCPRGYVNLRGACVVAAPTTSGVDVATGTAYYCGPAGCVFRLPQGPYCGSATGCTTACASPKYRLAFASPGFLCTE